MSCVMRMFLRRGIVRDEGSKDGWRYSISSMLNSVSWCNKSRYLFSTIQDEGGKETLCIWPVARSIWKQHVTILLIAIKDQISGAR